MPFGVSINGSQVDDKDGNMLLVRLAAKSMTLKPAEGLAV